MYMVFFCCSIFAILDLLEEEEPNQPVIDALIASMVKLAAYNLHEYKKLGAFLVHKWPFLSQNEKWDAFVRALFSKLRSAAFSELLDLQASGLILSFEYDKLANVGDLAKKIAQSHGVQSRSFQTIVRRIIEYALAGPASRFALLDVAAGPFVNRLYSDEAKQLSAFFKRSKSSLFEQTDFDDKTADISLLVDFESKLQHAIDFNKKGKSAAAQKEKRASGIASKLDSSAKKNEARQVSYPVISPLPPARLIPSPVSQSSSLLKRKLPVIEESDEESISQAIGGLSPIRESDLFAPVEPIEDDELENMQPVLKKKKTEQLSLTSRFKPIEEITNFEPTEENAATDEEDENMVLYAQLKRKHAKGKPASEGIEES